MANCLEGAPGWLRRDDSPLSASIAGKSPESLAREDECAAQFEEYLNSFRINATPMLRLTDSADVNLESLERIAKYFCIPVNVEERERICKATSVYAKDPKQTKEFTNDAATKRRRAARLSELDFARALGKSYTDLYREARSSGMYPPAKPDSSSGSGGYVSPQLPEFAS